VPGAARVFRLLDAEQHVRAASPWFAPQAGLNNNLRPALHRRPGCGPRFIRQVEDREAPRPKRFDVCFLVFQAPLLEHAQMRVVPRGLRYLAFGEAEIHRREMTARQVVGEIGCGETNRPL